MNKNIVIALLVIIIAVLGFMLVKGGGDLQQAATIKSQNADTSAEKIKFESAMKKDGGVTMMATVDQVKKFKASINATFFSAVPSPDLYYYLCWAAWSQDPVPVSTVGYYGNVWYPGGGSTACYFSGVL